MSFFRPPSPPPKPAPSSPSGPGRIRGDRTPFPSRAASPARAAPERDFVDPSWRFRREVLEIEPDGFLCGDPKKAYFDANGHYVVVKAKGRKIVERAGPRQAMQALTAEEREQVRLAKRRYNARVRKEAGK